jgi:hypothetical protein
MKCEEVDTLLIDYLDRKLQDSQVKEIEKHLESCEKCLESMMEMQKVLKALSNEEMEIPPDSLRINFYHMLHGEINKREYQNSIIPVHVAWYNRPLPRIAAAIALLIAGTFMGMLLNGGSGKRNTAQQIHQLQSDVTDLRKAALLTMLKEESSSYRIQGISYADEITTPDQNVIDALIKTLNTDKSVNVRLAALYALNKFSDQRSVCDSLVGSLSIQTEPIIQITLINILVDRKEKSAARLIQQIIDNSNTMKEVKTVAEEGVRQLMI